MDACQPLPDARFLVVYTLDEKWERPGHGYYYEVIDLENAGHPQTILAYEMNGQPVPAAHGAPLRLRVENQLGYKMAKWNTVSSLWTASSTSARDKAVGEMMCSIILLLTRASEPRRFGIGGLSKFVSLPS